MRNANGADIPADPTLTDAWSCPEAETWHPMPDRPPAAKAAFGFVTGARTGIRHFARAACLGASGHEGLRFRSRRAVDTRRRNRTVQLWPKSRAGTAAIGSADRYVDASSTCDRVDPIHRRETVRLVIDRNALNLSSEHHRLEAAWTVSSMPSRLSYPRIYRMLLRLSEEWPVPFRCPEAALDAAMSPVSDPPVIHFRAICLWKREDNSTIRRKLHSRSFATGHECHEKEVCGETIDPCGPAGAVAGH